MAGYYNAPRAHNHTNLLQTRRSGVPGASLNPAEHLARPVIASIVDFLLLCNLWFREHHRWLSMQIALSQAQQCVPWMMGMYQSYNSRYKQTTLNSSKSVKFCSALLSALLAMKHVSFTDILGFGVVLFHCHEFTSSVSRRSSQSPQIAVTFNCYYPYGIWTSDPEIKGTIPDPITYLLSPPVPEECDSLTELLFCWLYFSSTS